MTVSTSARRTHTPAAAVRACRTVILSPTRCPYACARSSACKGRRAAMAARRWGTEIDAYPDDEDALALLTTHAARAKAVWDVKRALAQRAVTKAERAEQAAALGAPEPASAAEVQETAREVVRAGKDTKLLRSVALAGCAVVLLMHASPWSACQPRAVRARAAPICFLWRGRWHFAATVSGRSTSAHGQGPVSIGESDLENAAPCRQRARRWETWRARGCSACTSAAATSWRCPLILPMGCNSCWARQTGLRRWRLPRTSCSCRTARAPQQRACRANSTARQRLARHSTASPPR